MAVLKNYQNMEKRRANRGEPMTWGTFLLETIVNSECKCDQETKQSFQQTHGTKLTKNEFQGMPRRISVNDSKILVGTLHH